MSNSETSSRITKAEHQIILDFLRTQPLAIISTIASGALHPQSALIAFTQTDKLEIIFETFVNTRKWHNLQQNPHVSFVVGWNANHHLTVQYEGTALYVAGDRQAEACIQAFMAKDTPCNERFLHDDRVRLFKVRPTWIRYSDYTRESPVIIEQKLGVKNDK